MPAAVENATRYTDYWGRTATEICNITWNNNDTFVSQFAAIIAADFTPTTNASFGLTVSGKTVTLVSGGSLTGIIQIAADNS
jgi:hypothetical protein